MILIEFIKCHVQLEKGVDGLFSSFARLDARISSVGQTAAKIGDHLQVKNCPVLNSSLVSLNCTNMLFSCQSADAQRETASQTIDLIKVPNLIYVYI